MVQSMPDCEILLGRGPRELVPGTDQLAVIATVDAIADRAAKFCGDAPGQLNGQVGDAAPCIETVGRDDGAGRARGHAGAAGAAVRGARLVWRQFKIQICASCSSQRLTIVIRSLRRDSDPIFRKLPELNQKIKELEAKIESLTISK